MENILKKKCEIGNHVISKENIKKGEIILQISIDDLICCDSFTDDKNLFTDPIFFSLNIVVNLKQYANKLSTLKPELIPYLWTNKTIDRLKGTPLHMIIMEQKYRVNNKVKESVSNCQDFKKFHELFKIVYSSIFSKGLIIKNNKGNVILSYVPILNNFNLELNKGKENIELVRTNENIIIKAKKDISKNEELKIRPLISDSPELNLLKFGFLPDNLDSFTLPLKFKEYKITLAKHMEDDDKKMLRRIRKNPKFIEIKKELQNIFNETIKVIDENEEIKSDCNDELTKYSLYIKKLLQDNYPK